MLFVSKEMGLSENPPFPVVRFKNTGIPYSQWGEFSDSFSKSFLFRVIIT